MARASKFAAALTADQFTETVKRFPRLSKKGRAVAYAVLVDGMTFDQVEQQFHASKQQAYKWALDLYMSFQPPGWVTTTVTLPPEMMAKVKEMEARARECLKENIAFAPSIPKAD